jgi:hypothetical protein
VSSLALGAALKIFHIGALRHFSSETTGAIVLRGRIFDPHRSLRCPATILGAALQRWVTFDGFGGVVGWLMSALPRKRQDGAGPEALRLPGLVAMDSGLARPRDPE